MQFKNATYSEDRQVISVEIDGVQSAVPASAGNLHFQAMQAQGIAVADYRPPPPAAPTADDIRAEASRRMQVLVGARDAAHLEIIIANATREAVRLLRKGQANWTPAETVRAAELEAVDQAIEAIRAASNLIEGDPPDDLTNDRHWP
jgi:hypothetical protein